MLELQCWVRWPPRSSRRPAPGSPQPLAARFCPFRGRSDSATLPLTHGMFPLLRAAVCEMRRTCCNDPRAAWWEDARRTLGERFGCAVKARLAANSSPRWTRAVGRLARCGELGVAATAAAGSRSRSAQLPSSSSRLSRNSGFAGERYSSIRGARLAKRGGLCTTRAGRPPAGWRRKAGVRGAAGWRGNGVHCAVCPSSTCSLLGSCKKFVIAGGRLGESWLSSCWWGMAGRAASVGGPPTGGAE